MRRPASISQVLRPRFATTLATLLLAHAAATPAAALPPTPIDLRALGSVGAANGALLYQDIVAPDGGGSYDPFLRLQGTPTEEAFNTDYRANGRAPLDAKSDPSYTHSLKLGSLKETRVGGVDYYVFSLAMDEPETDRQRHVSLDRVKIYLASAPDLSDLDRATLRWDLDGAGDRAVILDAGASISGKGGVRLFVPASHFEGAGENQYVYLYSVLGAAHEHGANSGSSYESQGSYEEWSALIQESSPSLIVEYASEPPALLLIGLGFAAWEVARRRFRRQPNS